MVSPVRVALSAAPPTLAVWPPGDAVTVYPVTAEPPFDAGGVQVTVACPLPADAVTPVGADGAPAAVNPRTATIWAVVELVLVLVAVLAGTRRGFSARRPSCRGCSALEDARSGSYSATAFRPYLRG